MGYFAHGVLNATRRTKLIAAVLLFGALAGAGFLVARREPIDSESGRQRAALAEKIEDARAKVLAEAGRDSDGDGLKDWEEEVFRTDSANADTDGDGTPDGEEIKLDRDPLKKGPNDGIEAPRDDRGTANSRERDNLTFNLAKNILESGALDAVDERGSLTSTDFVRNLNLPAGINPETLIRAAPAVVERDFKTSSDNSPAAVKRYFDALYAALNRNLAPVQQRSDIAILTEALRTSDYTKLAELDPIIAALDRAIAEMKKIPVPSSYRGFALNEANYLLQTKRIVEIFRSTQSDPVASAIVIPKRIELLREMADFHTATRRDLAEKGLVSATP